MNGKNLLPGEILRNARLEARLSQRELAEMIGVRQQYLNDIEHERRKIGEKHLPLLPFDIRDAVVTAEVHKLYDKIESLLALLD